MMRKLLFILVFVFISCFAGFSQTTLLLDTTFSISTSGNNDAIYLYNYSKVIYKTDFIANLQEALKTENIQLIFSANEKAMPFYINIAKLKLSEEIRTESVDDTASEQYGQLYTLSNCQVKVEYVLSTPNHQTIGSWKKVLLRQETLSNNRSFFEWLFGLNKNNTEYHKKTLVNNVFMEEIEIVATKTAKKIAKKIKKNH